MTNHKTIIFTTNILLTFNFVHSMWIGDQRLDYETALLHGNQEALSVEQGILIAFKIEHALN